MTRRRIPSRWTAGTRRAAALAAIAVVAAGCGSGERRVEPSAPEPKPYPVVAVPQAQGILDAVDKAVAEGLKERKEEAFGTRAIGPYRRLALAKGRIDEARKVRPAVPEVERERLLVPTGTQWPRFFLVVGSSEGQSTPVLRVVTSSGPREQYGLWSELTMLPGATLPEVPPPTEGTPMVAPDDGGLAVRPADVLPRFAAYLNSAGEKEAATFRPNAFSQQVIARFTSDRKSLKVTSTHTPEKDSPFSLRTADGGAIVVGAMVQRYAVKPKAGHPGVTVDPELAALAGGKKRARSFTRTAVEVVAFAVPPRGKGPVTVIAAQKGNVAAEAK